MGGGCHWCTEAVFQSLIGVKKVEQGFVSPQIDINTYAEAVIVHYNPEQINLSDLIEVHLQTHKSTSDHSFRKKYPSAIYAFNQEDLKKTENILEHLKERFEGKLITQVHQFGNFKRSEARFHDYYYNNPGKPFCETYISPKLQLLKQKFGEVINHEKINASHELP